MAELGSINFTDVNRGTRAPDRREEARALDNTLRTGAQAVKQGILAQATEDFQSAIDDQMAGATDAPNPIDTDAVIDPNNAEAKLKHDMDRWKLQAENGSTSQRALAEMNIKKILGVAQARFPFMVDDLQRRAGMVISGSAEMQALGMYDAEGKAEAARANQQIADMQKHAIADWEDGGLGISPSLEVGSNEWVSQFVKFDEMRSTQQANARTVGMFLSNRDASGARMEEAVTLALQGQGSLAMAGIHSALSTNGFFDQLENLKRGAQMDLSSLELFKTEQAPRIKMQAQQNVTELLDLYNSKVVGAVQGSPSGQRIKEMVDDHVDAMNRTIALLESSMDDMPDALHVIDSIYSIQGMEVHKGLTIPQQKYSAFMNGPGGFNLEIAKLSHTGSGLDLGEGMGALSVSILEEQFPDWIGAAPTPSALSVQAFNTSGQGRISSSMTAQGVNEALTKQQRDMTSPFYVPTKTDSDEQVAAFWNIDQHMRSWDTALSGPESGWDPKLAAQTLTGINYSVLAFNAVEDKPQDLSVMIRAGLSDDRLLHAIDTVGDDQQYVNQRRAVGATLKRWYANTNPAVRREVMLNRYNTQTIEGIGLKRLVRINVDEMQDNGNFAWSEDPRDFKTAVDRRFARFQQLDTVDSLDQVRRTHRTRAEAELSVREELIDAMGPIDREVNESISIERNLDHATAVNAQSRRNSNVKMQYFDQLGWLDGFITSAVE